MKTRIITLILSLISLTTLYAQHPKKAVVEHFTNTRCGICASRNPSFYQTLDNYPEVIHIAYHPSSPYNKCFFSLQNPMENDERTKYYNAYGSTPKVFLNGKQSSQGSTMITDTAIQSAMAETSPLKIEISHTYDSNDSAQMTINIINTNSEDDSLLLFACVYENPVQYNAPNGESVHHDVFRKAMTNPRGELIALPSKGASKEYMFTYKVDTAWNKDFLGALAILQNPSDKSIINAESKSIGVIPFVGNDFEKLSIFPNPSIHTLTLKEINPNDIVEIFDINGTKLLTLNYQFNINISAFSPGQYFIKSGNKLGRFIKLN